MFSGRPRERRRDQRLARRVNASEIPADGFVIRTDAFGDVSVTGLIEGNVQTAGRLEIPATGKVYRDITIGSLIIDEGGVLRRMDHDGKSPAIASHAEFKAAAA